MGLLNKICPNCPTDKSKLCFFLCALGPGLIVMLADTDVGSIITAAQSGALWGYKLLLLQIVLIPVLFIVQELTVRLGLSTGKGYGELIKIHFGKFWAWIAVVTLLIGCVGAIISELSGIAGVGVLFGVPIWLSMVLTIIFLMLLVLLHGYETIERIALFIGAFELIYFVVAWQAHPSLTEISQNLINIPLHNKSYLYYASAGIGAVIMPWMIFYQQSALVDKKLTINHIKISRLETAIGAIITQAIMIVIMIAIAATIGKKNPGISLQNIQDISKAITPFLGENIGKILFAFGMLGASLIATIVVLLTAAWSVGELTGFKHSLQDRPKEAPWFYLIFLVILIFGSFVVSSHVSLIKLNVAIQVLNAIMLPIILGFLFILACKILPKEHKISGWYAVFVGIIILITSGFGLIAGVLGIISG